MIKLPSCQRKIIDDESSFQNDSVAESHVESVSEPPAILPHEQDELSTTAEYFTRKRYSSSILSNTSENMKSFLNPVVCESNLDFEGQNGIDNIVNPIISQNSISDSDFPIPTATIVPQDRETPTFLNFWKRIALIIIAVVALVVGISIVLVSKGSQIESNENHRHKVTGGGYSYVMIDSFRISLLTYQGIGTIISQLESITSTHLHLFFISILKDYDSNVISVVKMKDLNNTNRKLQIQNTIVDFEAVIRLSNSNIQSDTSALFLSALKTAFTGDNGESYLMKMEETGIELLQVAVLDKYNNIIASSEGYGQTLNSSIPVTFSPTSMPGFQPSTLSPTIVPTLTPTENKNEDFSETQNPSASPTDLVSLIPSIQPSLSPTNYPSAVPVRNYSTIPSTKPTVFPTEFTSSTPTIRISTLPTNEHSFLPTNRPSIVPTQNPTFSPSKTPSLIPTGFLPSSIPTTSPIKNPSEFPTSFPTILPSKYVHDNPTEHPSQDNLVNVRSLPSLVTGPTRRRAGFMFDVKAKTSNITVVSLDVDLDISWSHSKVEVWTKAGTYKTAKKDPSAWTMNNYGQAFIIPQIPIPGEYVALPVRNKDTFEPIKIPKGETFGFYVTMPSMGMVTSDEIPNLTVSDEFVEIKYGGATGYPFAWTTSPRTWSGAVKYTINNEEYI